MRRTCTRVLPIVNVSPSATWRVQLPTLSTTPPITYALNRVAAAPQRARLAHLPTDGSERGTRACGRRGVGDGPVRADRRCLDCGVPAAKLGIAACHGRRTAPAERTEQRSAARRMRTAQGPTDDAARPTSAQLRPQCAGRRAQTAAQPTAVVERENMAQRSGAGPGLVSPSVCGTRMVPVLVCRQYMCRPHLFDATHKRHNDKTQDTPSAQAVERNQLPCAATVRDALLRPANDER